MKLPSVDPTAGRYLHDNQIGMSDTVGDPTTLVNGGSIVIHSK
ncbi:MAG TPA: hypothetical protein VIF83_05485 [Gemmatimonadaceae bacterium]